MRSSTRKRATTLAGYLSSGLAEPDTDWRQVAKDAAELAAIARAEAEIVVADARPPVEPPRQEATPATLRALLSVRQAAAFLGVSPDKVRRLVRAGELPGLKAAGRVRVRPEDLEAYVEASRIESDRVVERAPRARPRSARADQPGSLERLAEIERRSEERRGGRRG